MSNKPKRRRRRSAVCCDLAAILPPRLFKALADPNRISMLARLARCGRPCGVTEMADCCPIDFSVTSRHLAILRDAGIVRCEKRGKEVYYEVQFGSLAATLRSIAYALESCCPDRPVVRKGAKL